MKNRDGLIKFLIKPPIWLCAIIWVLGAVSLGGTITLYYLGLWLELWAVPVHIVALVFFILSIYALLTVIGVPERAKERPRVKQFFSSYNTRAFVYAAGSILFNGCYVVFGIIIANLEHSPWLGVLVGYHIFLVLPRAVIFVTAKIGKGAEAHTQDRQLRAYEYCGIALILLAIAVIPVIRMTMEDKNSYNYFISAIVYVNAIALYTFVKFGIAVYNFKKAHRQDDMSLIAVKNVSLADALISVFTLQVMMIKELEVGDTVSSLGSTLNPAFGAAVVIIILSIGLYMLINGYKKLRSVSPSDADISVAAEPCEETDNSETESSADGNT